MSKGTLDKRIGALQVQIKPRPVPLDVPEWAHWATVSELDLLEQIYRRAEDAGEMSEVDQHHATAIYSTAMARMHGASPEARADPDVRDRFVREIEDRDRPRWHQRRAEAEAMLRSVGLDPAEFEWAWHLKRSQARECAGILRRVREAKRAGQPVRSDDNERWSALVVAGELRRLGFGREGGG